MTNHLKSCIYFQRTYKTEPYFYPVGINQNPEVYKKLKNGIDEILKRDASSLNGEATTKL